MRVAVIYGGQSAERSISLQSGTAIIEALKQRGHCVEGMDLNADLFTALGRFSPDVVFIGLHGRLGEDGTVQGALELLRLPYVGSGVLASAIAMNKHMTKRILSTTHVPLANDVLLIRDRQQEIDEKLANEIGEQLGWPYIIKPNREGSTIGLTLAYHWDEAIKGITDAFYYDSEVLVEQYIRGTEVTAVVVGDTNTPEIMGVIEIIPKAGLYDFESKYTVGGSEHIIPARLDKEIMSIIEQSACTAYSTIGCQDYARVDFIIGPKGPVLLEINTLPGMTQTSLVPDASRARGQDFGTFLETLLQAAFRRSAHHT